MAFNDYNEIDLASAMDEADKCKYCKVADCSNVCPLNVDIKKIIELLSKGNYNDAFNALIEYNIMPEYTSCLCSERPICHAACQEKIQKAKLIKTVSNDSVNFPDIEKFIFTHVRDTIGYQIDVPQSSNKKIIIIGTNAAAIACAITLSLNGYSISMYEKDALIAQDLRFGLINSAKGNELVDQYEQALVEHGVEIFKNQTINVDFDLLRLKRECNFLVLTSNFEKTSSLNILGETIAFTSPINDVLHLVMYTKDFVRLENRNEYFKKEDRVIVIGSSNISLDTARIAHKFSDNVTLSFVNNSKFTGVNTDEIEKNELKNINVLYNVKPIKVQIVNREVQVTYRRTKNTFDDKMRNVLEDVFDTEWVETCDHLIIDSSSSSSINDQITKLPGISLKKDMSVSVDEKYVATNDGSVFCCGELIGENNSILDSIRIGMQIAKSIMKDSGVEYREYNEDYTELIAKQSENLIKMFGEKSHE